MSYLKGEVSVAGGQGTAVRMLGSFLFDRDAWGYRCLEKFARFLSVHKVSRLDRIYDDR